MLYEVITLVSYIFITDPDGRILAHTFTRPFPDELAAVSAPSSPKKYLVRDMTIHVV